MYYRLGMKDEKIREIQIALNLPPTSDYDRMTEAAVKNFQLKNTEYGLQPTGVCDPDTLKMLIQEEYTTDVSERGIVLGASDLYIEKYHLPADQYRSDNPTPDKKFIVLHHTASGPNPYTVIDGWKNDTRGRIATQYVIGGRTTKGDDYDGLIVEAFPDPFWASHLGNVSSYLHSHSIGIEICNWGILTEKNGKFYNYVGREIPPTNVYTFKEPFRGSKHYHVYSDAQIESVRKLLLHLSKKHNIDLDRGLKNWLETLKKPALAFDYFVDAVGGKVFGLLSHTSVRRDKSDVYPHPKLVDMIKSL